MRQVDVNILPDYLQSVLFENKIIVILYNHIILFIINSDIFNPGFTTDS